MKVRIIWQVLEVLLEEMKKVYEKSYNPALWEKKNLTDYYFLPSTQRKKDESTMTLGWSLRQRFPELEVGEKSVYSYLYIPVSKKEEQRFSFKSIYPDVFLRYIGMENLKVFLDWCMEKSLLSRSLVDQQLGLIEGNHPEEQEVRFNFFFYNGRKVVKGSALIYDWTKASLRFPNEPRNEQVVLQGEVENSGPQLVFKLRREHLQENSTFQKTQTFINLFFGSSDFRQLKYLAGTYSGMTDDNKCVSGKVVFQKFDEKENGKDYYSNSEVDVWIASQLFGTCFGTRLETEAEILFPQNETNEDRNQYPWGLPGVYKSYILINGETGPDLVRSIYRIAPSGEVWCKGVSNQNFKGFITLHASKTLAEFAMKTDDGFHDFRVLVRLDYKSDTLRLIGSYTGFYKGRVKGGLQILIKTAHDGESPEVRDAYDALEPKRVSFLDYEDNELKILLKQFFLGEESFKDHHISPSLRELDYLRMSREAIKHLPAFVGVYDVYSFSSLKMLRKSILKIQKDGKAVFFDHPYQYYPLYGDCQLSRNMLSIGVSPLAGEEDGKIHIKVFIGDWARSGKFQNLVGYRDGFNDDNPPKPASVRCVLVKRDKNHEAMSLYPQLIGLDSEQYEKLNENELHVGLGAFLSGAFNNYLETPIENDIKDFKPYLSSPEQGKQPLGQIFFQSACYAANCLGKSNSTEKKNLELAVLTQLERAFEHGFGILPEEKDLLETELDSGNLKRFSKAVDPLTRKVNKMDHFIHQYVLSDSKKRI